MAVTELTPNTEYNSTSIVHNIPRPRPRPRQPECPQKKWKCFSFPYNTNSPNSSAYKYAVYHLKIHQNHLYIIEIHFGGMHLLKSVKQANECSHRE